jgi:hypothetical protein
MDHEHQARFRKFFRDRKPMLLSVWRKRSFQVDLAATAV